MPSLGRRCDINQKTSSYAALAPSSRFLLDPFPSCPPLPRVRHCRALSNRPTTEDDGIKYQTRGDEKVRLLGYDESIMSWRGCQRRLYYRITFLGKYVELTEPCTPFRNTSRDSHCRRIIRLQAEKRARCLVNTVNLITAKE